MGGLPPRRPGVGAAPGQALAGLTAVDDGSGQGHDGEHAKQVDDAEGGEDEAQPTGAGGGRGARGRPLGRRPGPAPQQGPPLAALGRCPVGGAPGTTSPATILDKSLDCSVRLVPDLVRPVSDLLCLLCLRGSIRVGNGRLWAAQQNFCRALHGHHRNPTTPETATRTWCHFSVPVLRRCRQHPPPPPPPGSPGALAETPGVSSAGFH